MQLLPFFCGLPSSLWHNGFFHWFTNPSLHPISAPSSFPFPSFTYSSIPSYTLTVSCATFQILFLLILLWFQDAIRSSHLCCITQKVSIITCYHWFKIYLNSLTCAPEWYIWAILQAAEGICRFSVQAWEENHQWQCQSSAGASDRPQRSDGICPVSLAWKVQCRHWDDCYSIPNK